MPIRIPQGGYSFDQLCSAEYEPKYVYDEVCLVHILCEDTLEQATDKLVKKIDCLFNIIENRRGATINQFYIGKTYVGTKFGAIMDPMNTSTWKKDGISKSWEHHRSRFSSHTKDGMVAIAVITENQAPSGRHKQYTLELKNRLINYYKDIRKDIRLANNTDDHDKQDTRGSAMLYFTIGLSTEIIGLQKKMDKLFYCERTRREKIDR